MNNEDNRQFEFRNNELYKKLYSVVDVVKNKKKIAILILVLIFFAILLISIFLNKKPVENNKKIDASVVEVKEDDFIFSSWQAQSSDKILNLSKKIEDLNNMIDFQRKRNEQLDKKINDLEEMISKKNGNNEKNINGFDVDTEAENLTINKPEKLKGYPNINLSTNNDFIPISKEKLPLKNNIIISDKNETHQIKVSMPIANNKNKVTNQNLFQKNNINILPMGSFFKAILLNGLEAGTGQESEANPQPVLMRVIGYAFLPNEYRYQIQSCFVLGSAYGSLSSERVYIRTARFSCLSHKGRAVISTNIEGYVVDSDGKIGLRGKLVSRQGAKLGMAMLAGFSSGIASVFNGANSTSLVTPLGSMNVSNSTQSIKQAGLSGFGSASQELAQFYIRQAEEIFPVIEVNNGRDVTITLSQSLSLDWSYGGKDKLDDSKNNSSKKSVDDFNKQKAKPYDNNFLFKVSDNGVERK